MTTSEHTTCQLEIHRSLPAEPERICRALVEPSQAGVWLAAAANISPERGGAYELFCQPDTPERNSTIGCRITAIAPCHYLAFTWRGPEVLSKVMNDGNPPPQPTQVTITLNPTAVGTDVGLLHGGFCHDDGWPEAVMWHERSWSACLDNLEALLSDQPMVHPWS